MSEPGAARLRDPVAHSHALGGFLAGAAIGLAAAIGAAVVIGAVVGAAAAEVASAGLATPLIVGAVATVGEFGMNALVGGKLMGLTEEAGEALGAHSMGPASGQVAQGSPNVSINGRPAARVEDAESCDAGKLAQGSRTVAINGLAASRVGDKTTCGAVIIEGSANVLIGGPTGTFEPIQSEVPSWARWAVVVASLLPAFGGLARVVGPAIAEVEATGFARAAQTGAKALGRGLEERAGGGGDPLPSGAPPPSLYRVDGRPPGTIFNEGFQPKGTATDLQTYVNQNAPSAFVSTSKTADIANNLDFASPGKYLYEVDSSQVSGVDVNQAYPDNPYPHEQEMAVLGGVSPQAVLSAKPILPGGGLGNTIPNPGYRGGN